MDVGKPKTLIIVDDKNTAIRVLMSLAQDKKLKEEKTKIFGMCKQRHISLPTGDDPIPGKNRAVYTHRETQRVYQKVF